MERTDGSINSSIEFMYQNTSVSDFFDILILLRKWTKNVFNIEIYPDVHSFYYLWNLLVKFYDNQSVRSKQQNLLASMRVSELGILLVKQLKISQLVSKLSELMLVSKQ